MPEITVVTNRDCEMVDITNQINAVIPPGIKYGICHLFSPHTTAALTVNENVDPDVRYDILKKLDMMFPKQENFYRHSEGNSAAHLKTSLIGVSLALPIRNSRLRLGTWQGVYFCEFDGPRTRQVQIYFQAAEA